MSGAALFCLLANALACDAELRYGNLRFDLRWDRADREILPVHSGPLREPHQFVRQAKRCGFFVLGVQLRR
jgi:hypothetical protein